MIRFKFILITCLLFIHTNAYASSLIMPPNPDDQIYDDISKVEEILLQEENEQVQIYRECVDNAIDIFEECNQRISLRWEQCDQHQDPFERLRCFYYFFNEASQLRLDCEAELNYNLDHCEDLNPYRVEPLETPAPEPEEDNPIDMILPEPLPDLEIGESILQEELGLGQSILQEEINTLENNEISMELKGPIMEMSDPDEISHEDNSVVGGQGSGD